MKVPALLLFLSILPVIPGAARTFQENGGTTIEGDITRATSDRVTIRTRDGSLTELPLARLSEEDRDFVARWLAEPLPILQVTPRFSHAHEEGAQSREVLGLSVKIASPPETTPIDARLNYFLIGRCMEDQTRYKVLSVQSIDLKLPPDETTHGSFRPVANHFVDTKGRGKGARCIGYVLQTTRQGDGRQLHAVGSIPILQEHLQAILSLDIGEETDGQFVPLEVRTDARRAGTGQVTVK